MESRLRIENFKSIKLLDEEVRRINIFVGEPNTGKSNILEALGFISFLQHVDTSADPRKYIRFSRISNLFYDETLGNAISIKYADLLLSFSFSGNNFTGEFVSKIYPPQTFDEKEQKVQASQGSSFTADYNRFINLPMHYPKDKRINYYKFGFLESSTGNDSEYLLPPDGPNLLSILLTRPDIRNLVNAVFSRSRLRMVLKPQDNSIEAVKDLGDVLISYPYVLLSDTIQRVIFHLCAILSNKNATLVFEEPEAHAFPFYTKQLAEMIALDKNNNRYFIATHNPYFLQPVIEKTPLSDIAVFITYFDEYQTKVKRLTDSEIEEIMQIDVFSNLDRYLDKT